ncbi:hypothetical protein ZIOFF_015128 [Zingiber officinale]|uniref:Uncharacterized protein n=1 Tax=Zingiber officinale TaxID=94328 RepID=A0A8J5HI80_ZINOF|nr:hypothetical protein ZIOFF_015128 [Zingiber officinale]
MPPSSATMSPASVPSFPPVDQGRRLVLATSLPLFAAASVGSATASSPAQGKHAFDLALSGGYVAKTLARTSVYTVSNSNNEFILISDSSDNFRSLGILCFRQEDAQPSSPRCARRLKSCNSALYRLSCGSPFGQGSKICTHRSRPGYFCCLFVCMLKLEGIACRFLPHPLQIKNALTLRSADISQGFDGDGVPVFQFLVQLDLLIVKKKNKRCCPKYFQKSDNLLTNIQDKEGRQLAYTPRGTLTCATWQARPHGKQACKPSDLHATHNVACLQPPASHVVALLATCNQQQATLWLACLPASHNVACCACKPSLHKVYIRP